MQSFMCDEVKLLKPPSWRGRSKDMRHQRLVRTQGLFHDAVCDPSAAVRDAASWVASLFFDEMGDTDSEHTVIWKDVKRALPFIAPSDKRAREHHVKKHKKRLMVDAQSSGSTSATQLKAADTDRIDEEAEFQADLYQGMERSAVLAMASVAAASGSFYTGWSRKNACEAMWTLPAQAAAAATACRFTCSGARGWLRS